ncbi:hypothetical protein, conserved [Leishmania tarentolae]|uniref:Uncharacterized protein n=1 Tax=Leishmania tarentolae TaxID=5689 RepID=A0A640L064_LEITA|nr:hypothetical protein, conserved [Leishmania tarentolae]
MRSLRSRAVGSLHPSNCASSYHDAAFPTRCAWRCLSTTAQNSPEKARTDGTPPPLEKTFASPLRGQVTPDSVLLSPMDSTIPCSRLSQRQLRQRQRKGGALWRYRWESQSLRAMPTPFSGASALMTASPRTSVCASHVDVSQDTHGKTVRCDAEKGALVDTLASSNSRSVFMTPAENEANKGTRPIAHPASAGAAVVGSATNFSTHSGATLTSSAEDPLLSFLDSHEEDAALLLAMWTSLHRSCVFGSALSESLVLQLRFFLHSLLRYRAIGAAVNFYYRLMGIGVQLRQSDLLLLFSSLTYESCAFTEEAQLRKAAQSAVVKKEREWSAQRRRQVRESAARTCTADSVGQHQRESGGEGRDKTIAGKIGVMNGVVASTGASGLCEDGISRAGTINCESGRFGDDVYPPGFIARRVAFDQQPEWVKRWILYEASMGTLDDLDDVEAACLSSTSSTSNAADTLWSASDIDEDTMTQSDQAMQAMEMAAIVDHLHLLTLGAMQRDHLRATETSTRMPSPRRPWRCMSRLSHSDSAERAHWKEAVHLVRSVYASVPRQTAVSDLGDNSSSPVAEAPLLPADVVFTLQAMIREVQSWEGALFLLRLASPEAQHPDAESPRTLRMSPDCFLRGAVLFMALAVPAQPWKTQAKVEEWMHRVMLPRLGHHMMAQTETTSTVTAATAALHVLWLSHLCSVKASRPDEFVALGEEASAYFSAHTVKQAIRGDLSLMMAEVCNSTERAVEALYQTALRAEQHRRASEVLAKSIRTGAYRIENDKDEHELKSAPESNDMIDSLSTAGRGAPITSMHGTMYSPLSECATKSSLSSSAFLPDDVMDAFALCCAAVKETVWLRFTTAASTSPATVVVEVLQFLERSVHGPSGLLNTFKLLYNSPAPRLERNGKRSALSPTVDTSTAPECAYVSCVLATTLLQLVQLLCAPPGQPQRRFGCQVWNGAELVLLVELAAKMLEGIAAVQVQQAPWRWAVEKCLKELASVTAKTVRLVVRQRDIHRMNEKVMFGAMPDEDVELFAFLARVLNKSSELMVASRAGYAPQTPSYSPVWRILTSTCSPRVLQGVYLCFHSSSALGKRVRYRLYRRDAEKLDRWIQLPHSRQRTPTGLRGGRGSAFSSSNRSMNAVAANAAPVVGRYGGRDFPLTLSLRDSVYKIVTRERTSDDVGQALQRLAAATADWKASLLLCHLVTKDVALARGTCNVDFFATTLDRMAQDVEKSSASARAVTRASELKRNCARPSRKSEGKVAAPHAVGPPNLWMSAINVFWSAVDHVVQVETTATQHSSASAVAASTAIPTVNSMSADAHERAVLTRLLLPLLRFSRAVHQQEIGRHWRRTWAAMYAPQEKKNTQWRRQNISALSMLGDPAALTQCVTDYRDCDKEALLCSVAIQHGDWHSALEAVFRTYGAVEKRLETRTTYSLVVARTILTLLSKPPMNLSNTAMVLRAIQRETWDVECSLAVVRLLLRGRRWRLALTHVDEALELPDMQRVRALVLVDPDGRLRREASPTAPTAAMLVQYAHLFTAALQATAIGGDSERATAYYGAFKALVRYTFGEVVAMDTLHTAEDATPNGGDELDAALGMTHITEMEERHPSRLGDEVQEALRQMAPRARIFFFRSMTKKMLSSHGGRSQ